MIRDSGLNGELRLSPPGGFYYGSVQLWRAELFVRITLRRTLENRFISTIGHCIVHQVSHGMREFSRRAFNQQIGTAGMDDTLSP